MINFYLEDRSDADQLEKVFRLLFSQNKRYESVMSLALTRIFQC